MKKIKSSFDIIRDLLGVCDQASFKYSDVDQQTIYKKALILYLVECFFVH